MKDLLVVGGASLDRLQLPLQTALTAGGAGLYTAAAAHSTGATVTMYAPRPQPMPDCLQPLDERIEWVGPIVTPEELPHFKIEHCPDGRTNFDVTSFGKEAFLDPADLPEDLSRYRLIHITPVGSGEHQLELLQDCRKRGALRISAGTYPCMLEDEPHFVRKVFDAADLFFMNEQEATKLFGSVHGAHTRPGKFLFITMAERGAMVLQGQYRTHVPAIHAEVLDPTGAGDTFCGATLAGIARGMHPVVAARNATSLAATIITAIGPTALWDSEPKKVQDPRIHLDHDQIARVADLIGSLHEVIPFDFTGLEFPPVNHSAAVDYFFAATPQQFGFWETAGGRYKTPMIASIGGVRSKGSDYLWRAFFRKLTSEQGDFCFPSHQAKISREEMLELFRDDDGSDPMPELDLHLEQAHAYGKDMLSLDLSPQKIVDRANASEQPLRVFLEQLDHVVGIKKIL
jgi:sugar/nucleoside kinase (ribokinase family)